MLVPFKVGVKELPQGKGYWSLSEVTVFDDQKRKLGSYVRNYPSYSESTFHPFFLEGRWWALYSPNYTTTRVLTLPEVEDWCGEEPGTFGFCPVDFYVPRFRRVFDRKKDSDGYELVLIEDEPLDPGDSEEGYEVGEVEWCPFGFVAGCIWGDDTSWKIQYLDLSDLKDREIRREERFGYVEIAKDMPLKDAVVMENWEPEQQMIALKCLMHFDLRNKERANPLDL